MDYFMGIIRALVPRKLKDAIAMAILVPAFSYAGYKTVMPIPPNVTVFSETTYPTEVARGGYFFLSFDLAWDQNCELTAKRYITGSDGVEYLALEDTKQVIAGQRTKYIARIPVDVAIPYGKASIRSDFEYACDWWSQYIRSIKTRGRTRAFEVLPQSRLLKPMGALSEADPLKCGLKPEPGFTIVRAHYRRVTNKLASLER